MISTPVSTTKALSLPSFHYSSFVWTAAAKTSQIHGLWKIYIQGKIYLNPDNFFGLVSGMTYQALIGDHLFLKLPTVPFFVMARFFDLCEQEDAWRGAYKRWISSLRFTQPIYVPPKPLKKGMLFSFSFAYSVSHIKHKSKCLWIRIQRIAFFTLNLGVQSFKLLMRILDIVELMTFDSKTLSSLLNQSVRESGIHIPRCLGVLEKNKHVLLARLMNNRSNVDKALQTLGAKKITADHVINTTKTLFEYLEKGLHVYKETSNGVGESIRALGKTFIYEWSPDDMKNILQDLDLAPKRPSWLKKNHKPCRCFPSVALISSPVKT
jgi:hypothetical protein